MKITLEFELPEEEELFDNAVYGAKFHTCLKDIRKVVKATPLDASTFWEVLSNNGVELDD